MAFWGCVVWDEHSQTPSIVENTASGFQLHWNSCLALFSPLLFTSCVSLIKLPESHTSLSCAFLHSSIFPANFCCHQHLISGLSPTPVSLLCSVASSCRSVLCSNPFIPNSPPVFDRGSLNLVASVGGRLYLHHWTEHSNDSLMYNIQITKSFGALPTHMELETNKARCGNWWIISQHVKYGIFSRNINLKIQS